MESIIQIFPVCYVPMTERTSACYQSVFRTIEQKLFELEPDELITDFEAGLRHAIRKRFPEARLRGCWYHYCAAVRKRLVKLGLSKLFKSNDLAKIIKKQLMCLPLLPSEFFEEGYTYIKDKTIEWELFDRFAAFFKYYENYWFKQVYL